jgi:flagellar hook-associated protein 3 FlgL
MRITTNMFPEALIGQLNKLTSKQSKLQLQVASGQRIQQAEDDPAALRRVLQLQQENSSLSQYQSNIGRMTDVANASFSSIKGLKKICDRATEIATLADGLKSPEEMRAYGTELAELIKQGAQLANTKAGDEFLFGGTKSGQSPFTLATGPDNEVASVSYSGNDQVIEVEVSPQQSLSAHVPGANSSASGARGLISDTRSGADFFNHLISLQNHLLAGDSAAVAATDRASLAKDESNLVYHLAGNGATQERLQAASSMGKDRALALEGLISSEADTDVSQTIVRLGQVQTAYQAALQSASTILNTSLMDYLR